MLVRVLTGCPLPTTTFASVSTGTTGYAEKISRFSGTFAWQNEEQTDRQYVHKFDTSSLKGFAFGRLVPETVVEGVITVVAVIPGGLSLIHI